MLVLTGDASRDGFVPCWEEATALRIDKNLPIKEAGGDRELTIGEIYESRFNAHWSGTTGQ